MSAPSSRRPRTLAADPVFDALAGAILRGSYAPGSALPPERELSARFNVSRLIARQALHRLRDMGLVSGGQGGQNTVRDPDDAVDPRIIALQMEFAPEQADERDVTERQMLGGAAILELAQLRMTEEEIAELDRMVAEREGAASRGRDDELARFETTFWTFIARCTRNKVLHREARWWFTMLQDQPERRDRFYDRPEMRLAVYRSIVENLKAGDGQAAQLFLTAVRPVLQSRRD
jgi:GntR family transcriptional regulator, transcriptional repressor for pyruvate dehydrogenase complex